MKIAIDCRYLNKSGIGRALENILMNIDYSANQYFLIGKKELLDKYNATIIDDNSEPYSKNGLLSFPKEINKECDCLFIPNFLVPYGIKIPIYTIMHDVIFLDLPKMTTNGFIDYHIKYYLLKRCLRKSKKVFCISNFTKDRTAYHFKKYQDKLVVNYDGMSTKVLNYKVDKNIKKENQIVFVGNVKQHKGLITLLAAFKNREDKSLRLKIIGSKDNFLTGLKLNENDFEDVIFTNRISDEELFWEDKWKLPIPIYENDKATYKFTGWYLGNVLIPQTGDSWTYANNGGTLVAKWAVVSYKTGNYPQTKITDESLISTLNSKAGTLPTLDNSYNWHYVDYYDDYSNYNPTKNMWYQDISIKSNKYRGVYFTKYRGGEKYQENNLYYLNTIYWFKYEPILWRGLSTSSNNVMLVSEQLLDVQAFYPETYSNPQGINKSITYEYSYIREWLNNDFYNCAFTIDEKNTIKITNVDNSTSTKKPGSSTYKTWNNTNDNVFLLSYNDAKIYFSDDNDRIASPTDYAECLGIWKSSLNYKSPWITRSPEWHYSSTSLPMITEEGLPAYDVSPSEFNGIRPAITLTL